MTAQRQPWPEQLAGTPAVAVIERAIEKRRLSHSLLLAGGDTAVLGAVAAAIADRLLNGAGSAAAFPVSGHPDAHELRPAKKMRQISAEATRDLITELQKTPAVAPRKVAIIHECDRMHVAAANIFLKTLEEPPANTTLLLTTARPHALLPTIRSRCLLFRFPAPDTTPPPNGWDAWLADYREWLGQLAAGVSGKTGAADALMTLYGLLARFGGILDAATEALLDQQAADAGAALDKEELAALKSGHVNALRLRLFAEIAAATRDHALPAIQRNDAASRRALVAALETLEHNAGLLRLNLNELAALEDFLLASLRLWTVR